MFNSCNVRFKTLLTFSGPLSVTICKGATNRGNISSVIKWLTVFAFLFGTGKHSGHPLYMSIKVTMYWFPKIDLGNGLQTSSAIFADGNGGISNSCNLGLILLEFLVWQVTHLLTYSTTSLNRQGQKYFILIAWYVLSAPICPFSSWYCTNTLGLRWVGIYSLTVGSSSGCDV